MIRALIVDDEVHAREELAALLSETGAVTVVGSAPDAVAGMRAIRQRRPEIVFLDVQMPAVNGFEMLSMMDDVIPEPTGCPKILAARPNPPGASAETWSNGGNAEARHDLDPELHPPW